ncbi:MULTISPECIES: hypothetical protein [Thermoanaerobacterium]|uniref:Uncharacterized protein n=2 Tax=Thermoanaerobacterium TaxID=28895 RepID=W9E7Z6_9THEO|nr:MULTISPECIES: hypothetical protein [Thermoanaerobacterium]AFK87411.1 hypothetical protein Tsac_2413 [Thermoanaerobacterium saccharolyticum JW/SL-YS485]ETO37782.1 hypothetical protein V518_2036 [Thermoanaerobacterium aotearoense SCUT27]
MTYTKTQWEAGITPLNSTNLNHLESQYDEVKTELQKTDGTSDIKIQAINCLIQDANGYFSSSNIEGALQELYTISR